MKNVMFALWRSFSRRKPIEKNQSTRLKKCLGTTELTALGIGSTLGIGIYVIIGTVAYKQAGPSVVLSFIIAAISSIFAGLCYAEFGALVPKAGSAYVYSYICVGELMAFIIGWNLILEYIIGAASVARGYSNYLDGIFDNKIQNFFKKTLHLELPHTKWFSDYPDLFAFSLTMILSVVLSFGVKESTQFNLIFTAINFFVVFYCVIVGSFKINFHNWNISKDEIPADVDGGKGGFFPFGIKGMISGAATCFYSFVGFDAIATTGEEVLDPQRSLPISIILSLTAVTIAYCAVSSVQTLMWPYWDQNHGAPLPYVFEQLSPLGALAGLSTSLIGAMFPMPRIIYAMADDRLLFRFLSRINQRFKTPVVATIISGFLAALMATFFNIDELAEMMSIGTLLAYTLVAISVLILRYQRQSPSDFDNQLTSMITSDEHIYQGSLLKRIVNWKNSDQPDEFSSNMSMILIAISFVLVFVCNFMFIIFEDDIWSLTLPIYGIVLLIGIFIIFILSVICLARQPRTMVETSFQVPYVPYIPFFSVFANTYLMVHLNQMTWYRFIGWMFLGFIIYFSYGLVKSVGYLTQVEKNRLSLDSDDDQHEPIDDVEENTIAVN
ncbi:High affinity cationic amino acid transporter 1 [Dermatophagoides farinae]|uniref:High affinity cationic amino acid transporter 1 n=1 Tax=Dermatophagoides farinae TaxID=6954 RepID=A0A922HQG2_DERFA|nr:High affinity cationic amino acid transporter 1 [Dermatophagoides farinae]